MTKEYAKSKVKLARIAEAALKYDASRKEEVTMSTISSKNQITLPAHLLRELGLTAGDRLAVRLEGDRLILRARPKNWVERYRGSLKGLYGDTREDVDAYIKELRDDRGHDEEIEEAWHGQRPAPEE